MCSSRLSISGIIVLQGNNCRGGKALLGFDVEQLWEQAKKLLCFVKNNFGKS